MFAPFSEIAQRSPDDCICYVLRRDDSDSGADFRPYYCANGAPSGAVLHYRVEFEALLRKLFNLNYRYIMKPFCR